jgi:hypothetical protein
MNPLPPTLRRLTRSCYALLLLWLIGCGAELPTATVSPEQAEQVVLVTATATPLPTATPTAVPLVADLPTIESQFHQLLAQLEADMPLNAPAIGTALHLAALPDIAHPQPTTVALQQWAQILAWRSFDPAVQQTAHTLATLINQAELTPELQLPLTANDPLFLTPLPSGIAPWQSFLANWQQHNSQLLPPTLDLINQFPEADTNLDNPAYLAFQLTGQQVADVRLVAGRFTNDGRRQLLNYSPIYPAPTLLPDGQERFWWPDGRHRQVIIWPGEGMALQGGDESLPPQLALLWHWQDGEDGAEVWQVLGEYVSSAGVTFPAALLLGQGEGEDTAVWQLSPTNPPQPYTPQPGDSFAPYVYYLDEQDALITSPGEPLALFAADGTGGVRLRAINQPLPDDNYFLGVEATNQAGQKVLALTNLAVTNEASGATGRTYLDPYLGFQFPYPADWQPPRYEGSAVWTRNQDETAELRVTWFPNTPAGTPRNLLNEALGEFGGVDLLYEQESSIGQEPTWPAAMAAYGYRTPTGEERTGLLLAFIYQQHGYVLDVDAPATEEAAALALLEGVRQRWQFRSLVPRLFGHQWREVRAQGVRLPIRDDFWAQAAGEWERVSAQSDARQFMAWRTAVLTPTQSLPERLGYWGEIANRTLPAYLPQEPRRWVVGERLWLAQPFSYTAVDGEAMTGLVLLGEQVFGTDAEGERRELVVWLEAPTAVYETTYQQAFAIMLASLAWE